MHAIPSGIIGLVGFTLWGFILWCLLWCFLLTLRSRKPKAHHRTFGGYCPHCGKQIVESPNSLWS